MVWGPANEQTWEARLKAEIGFYMQLGSLEKCEITRVGYPKTSPHFLETEGLKWYF